MEELQSQFAEANIDFVGVQETRHKAQHYFQCDRYHVLSGAATSKGHGGVQLWIAKQLSCGLRVTKEHLTMLHQDPQKLFVLLHHPEVKLIFLVAHAPTLDKMDELEQWWQQVDAILRQCPNWPVVSLLDANSRVGFPTSSSVGDSGATPENASGAWFHEWLIRNDFWAPSTFADCHIGDHDTWFHANGASARLDYVVLSKDLKDSTVKTWIPQNVDLSITRADHLPVCCIFDMWIQESASRPKTERRQNVQEEATLKLPSQPWSLNIHEHANCIEERLRSYRAPKTFKDKLRKKHLTEATWTLIKAKRACWRNVLALRSNTRLGILRELWNSWRCSTASQDRDTARPHVSFQPWLRWSQFETARWSFLHGRFSTEAARAVREDDQTYYDALARRAGEVDTQHGIKQIWKEVAAALPKAQTRKKNNIAQQPPFGAMQQHFDQLEAGEPISFKGLVESCQALQSGDVSGKAIEVDLCDLPSRLTVERLCLKAIPGKAAGLDEIDPALLKCHAPQVGLSLTELFMKMWILGSEPVTWKGGQLCPIWKSKGSKQDPAAYRGIVLLPALGKRWHALLRQELLPHVLKAKLDSQFGGFPGQQPGFATSLVRSYSNIAHSRGLSDACIFLDLRSAFHHLVRQFAWRFEDGEFSQRLRDALHQEGLDVTALAGRVGDESKAGVLPLPQHLNKLLVDLHQCTWYTLKGADQPSVTFRGTRPGSPFADLGFNAFMSQIMIAIRELLWQNGDIMEAFQTAGVDPIVIGWVDDLAIPVMSTEASRLTDTIRDITEGIVRIMWEAGLQVNLGKGKTECVANFRGHKAPAMRATTFVEDLGQIPLTLPAISHNGQQGSLHLVGRYVHLGTCFGQELHFDGEVNRRVGAAMTSFRQVARPVLGNKHISIATRLQLFEALVCSKLMYNSGTWPQLSKRQHARVEHAIISWQRRIIGTGFWSQHTINDQSLQRIWKLPSLEVRLAVARLRFALAAHRHAYSTTWRLLGHEYQQCNKSWIHLLLPALQWLTDVIPACRHTDTPCGELSFAALDEWFGSEHCPSKSHIRRALKKHLIQEQIIEEVKQGYERVRGIFEKLHLYFPEAAPVAVGGWHHCDLCPKSFPRAQQLQIHKWSKHGVISAERQFVFGPVCESCGKNFWTTQRMQQHLRSTRHLQDGCFERLRKFRSPVSQPVRFGIPPELKHIQRLPALPAQPPTQFVGPTVFEAQQAAELRQWHEEWKDFGLPETMPNELWSTFSAALQEATGTWDARSDPETCLLQLWFCALRRLQDDLGCTDELAQWFLIEWLQRDLPDVTAAWDDPDDIVEAEKEAYEAITCSPVYELLAKREKILRREPQGTQRPEPDAGPSRIPRDDAITSHFRNQDDFLKDVLQPTLFQPKEDPLIPVIIGPQGERILLMVHLFAGRRREGDFHWWIDQIADQWFPGYHVWVASYDTAIDPVRGNFTGSNYEQLVKLAECGVISASVSGPPCETFSPARHLDPPAELKTRWPRPLRSQASLWGIPDRSIRELEQLRMGNRLYINCNVLEFNIALRGGMTLLEHPADPQEDGKSSSWQSQLNQHYSRHVANSGPIRVNQWRYGAPTVKPTVIRAMGTQEAKYEIHRHYLGGIQKPTKKLSGIDDTGQFCTAAAKEYPTAMSKGLAFSVAKTLVSRLKLGQRTVQYTEIGPLFEWVRTTSLLSKDIRHDAVMMPDYQRWLASLLVQFQFLPTAGWIQLLWNEVPTSCPEIGKKNTSMHISLYTYDVIIIYFQICYSIQLQWIPPKLEHLQ